MLKFLLIMLLSSAQKVAYYPHYPQYYAHEKLVPLFVPNCSLITLLYHRSFYKTVLKAFLLC